MNYDNNNKTEGIFSNLFVLGPAYPMEKKKSKTKKYNLTHITEHAISTQPHVFTCSYVHLYKPETVPRELLNAMVPPNSPTTFLYTFFCALIQAATTPTTSSLKAIVPKFAGESNLRKLAYRIFMNRITSPFIISLILTECTD